MLKTVSHSTANKTAGLAVTYRSGDKSQYGTCPVSCSLAPSKEPTAQTFDTEYFEAELTAVPVGGYSFTYSHYDPSLWWSRVTDKTTAINYSADKLDDAIKKFKDGVPVVTVVPLSFWDDTNGKSKHVDGVPVVRCENETNNVNCGNCGNNDPWCNRINRDFIIAFTSHGSQKKLASDAETKGGCYAGNGNCAIHWRATLQALQPETDAERLQAFVKTLPRGTGLRHRVAGDFGKD